MDTFTIFAEYGEYPETAPDIDTALRQFHARRDDFVYAVVNNGMRPRLVIESAPVEGFDHAEYAAGRAAAGRGDWTPAQVSERPDSFRQGYYENM